MGCGVGPQKQAGLHMLDPLRTLSLVTQVSYLKQRDFLPEEGMSIYSNTYEMMPM